MDVDDCGAEEDVVERDGKILDTEDETQLPIAGRIGGWVLVTVT